MRILQYLSLVFILSICACKPDKGPSVPAPYETGVFVTNEGLFNQTSGTISFYNPDSTGPEQKIFNTVNGRDLGNVVQSMAIQDSLAYIVVNNSNKVEVVNSYTFKEYAQITDLQQPRYFLPVSSTIGYVSQWGADGLTGSVKLIDLNTFEVLDSIPTNAGPERMILVGNQLWVVCTGGYGTENKLEVINTNTNSIETTITIDDAPHSLYEGRNNDIWIACAGKVVYSNYPTVDTALSTAGSLVCVNPTTFQIVLRIIYEKGKRVGPTVMNDAGNSLFHTYDGQILRYNIPQNQHTTLYQGSFYGLGYDPKNDELYAARNTGIDAAHTLRLRTNGTLIDSFQVGVFANNFVFR